MFEGFTLDDVRLGDLSFRVRHGGRGPAVLLLHGHPRTHATWHRVAPLVAAAGYTVVCPDLRGYGGSAKPPTTADHAPYSKRAMAGDCVAILAALGHERFAVVGHDRGGYVAQRLALDFPAAVTQLVVLDDVPIGEALARCDATFATRWWHWFFYAQSGTPERVICADPDAWYGGDPAAMGLEAYEDYRRAIHDPATVHAMLEDYRAGLTVDRAADDADRAAGRRIACPTLVLWARRDDLELIYGDVAAIWRTWADRLSTGTLDCGHHTAEEAPAELAARLLTFFENATRRDARRGGTTSPS